MNEATTSIGDGEEAVKMMDGYAMSGWAWLLMTLGVLGFWALVAVVAAERLARGEIDADEYRQRLQILQEATGRR